MSIKLSSLLVTTLLVSFTVADVPSQQRSTTDPVLQKLGLGSGVGNCEINSLTLDHVRSRALENRDSAVIAIARLGKGEMSNELNRRRLYTVRTYLAERGLPSEMLVSAVGDPVSGYGRIDFYLEGKLSDALIVDSCRDLPVGSCLEDFYVGHYYLPRKGKLRWCR